MIVADQIGVEQVQIKVQTTTGIMRRGVLPLAPGI